MTPTEILAPPVPACAHCGLPVPEDTGADETGPRFCCTGCAAVWDILHGHGLDRYYDLPERRLAPVQASGRSYDEFDHPAFHALYARPAAGGLLETELYLEGVHCASCVWLVERAPLLIPGVARAELEVGRALARVAWDPAATSLAAIARFLDGLGYRAHPFRGGRMDALRKAEDRAMLVRIGVAGALAANVMTVAIALYAGWLDGMEPVYFNYFRWISLLLTTPALLWPGRVFFQGAFGALRARTLHMDVPIAVALAAGYTRGAINTVTGTGPIYFDGVAALIFLLLVGRFLQQRAQRAATNATELLHGLSPATARMVDGTAIREVPTEALIPGMLVEIRAGDTVPADGVVVEGRSELDLALLTGESRPKVASPGDRVFAGTVNLASGLRVEVEQSGEASRLGRLLRQVEAGAGRRAPVVQAADRLAGRFVAVVLLLALVTFAYWWPRDPDRAVDHAIALLIVTCPCALALATPLAITVAIGRAARTGVLIKGGDALEVLARPGTLYLDKTGTLTEGRTSLVAWEGPDEIRPLILALERHSTHPVAAGFLAAWPDLPVVDASGRAADARRWARGMGRGPARRGGFTGLRRRANTGTRGAPRRGRPRADPRPDRGGWAHRRAGRIRGPGQGRSGGGGPAAAGARLAPSIALGRRSRRGACGGKQARFRGRIVAGCRDAGGEARGDRARRRRGAGRHGRRWRQRRGGHGAGECRRGGSRWGGGQPRGGGRVSQPAGAGRAR